MVAEVVRFNRDIIKALRLSEDTEPARLIWRSLRVAAYNEPGTLGKTIGEHTLYKLLLIMEGDLDEVIDGLLLARKAEQLEELEFSAG